MHRVSENEPAPHALPGVPGPGALRFIRNGGSRMQGHDRVSAKAIGHALESHGIQCDHRASMRETQRTVRRFLRAARIKKMRLKIGQGRTPAEYNFFDVHPLPPFAKLPTPPGPNPAKKMGKAKRSAFPIFKAQNESNQSPASPKKSRSGNTEPVGSILGLPTRL